MTPSLSLPKLSLPKDFPLSSLVIGLAWALAWLKGRRKGHRRLTSSVSPDYRFLQPAQYVANNPGWLKQAILAGPGDPALPPPLRIFLEQVQSTQGQNLPDFGFAARQELFALSPHITYLNHGSYGAAYRLALEVQGWYQQQLELEPVHFMETVAVQGVLNALSCVATLINSEPSDLVALPNATTALNTVLAGLTLQQGDVLLMFNTTYPAVRSALARKALIAGATLLEVTLTLEDLTLPHQQVTPALQRAVRAVPRGRLKLAVIDYVISFPPVILPVVELTRLCRQAGALVFVDAAHAVGTLPGLDIPALGADYVTSNLHKWCCTPKGTAFLWVHPRHQATLKPLVTSHGYGLGMQGEFLWLGTADPSAWLAVPSAIHVLQSLGEHRVADYNHRLVAEAAQQLVMWSASHLASAPADVAAGSTGRPQLLGGDGVGGNAGMLAVALPPLSGYLPASPAAAARLKESLFSVHNIEIPVIFLDGRLWVRLSAQIYNCLRDYQRLTAALHPLAQSAVASTPWHTNNNTGGRGSEAGLSP